MTLETTLNDRDARYGGFDEFSETCQKIKSIIYNSPGYEKMNPLQKESMDMVAHKLTRIIMGDPNYLDSWQDLAGYAQLVVDYGSGNTSTG